MKFALNTIIAIKRNNHPPAGRRKLVRLPDVFLIGCLVLSLSIAVSAYPQTIAMQAAGSFQPDRFDQNDSLLFAPANPDSPASVSAQRAATGEIETLVVTEDPDTDPVTAKTGHLSYPTARHGTAYQGPGPQIRRVLAALYVFYNSLLL